DERARDRRARARAQRAGVARGPIVRGPAARARAAHSREPAAGRRARVAEGARGVEAAGGEPALPRPLPVMRERRRIYLMRHAQVSYFERDGRPVRPDQVVLTAEGERQGRAAADGLAAVRFDRVVTSGLPRTLQTAWIVAPGSEPESLPELREIEGGRLASIPEDDVEQAFLGVFRDVVPEETAFLGGETIGALLDRV